MSSAANDSHKATGYVRLYRSLFDDETHPLQEQRAFTRYEAKIDLLQNVRGTNQWRDIDGQPFLVERGSQFFSVRYLKKRWKWGSNQKVLKFLRFLELRGYLTKKVFEKGTLITIVNYNDYNPLRELPERKRNAKGTPAERERNEYNKGNTGKEGNASAQVHEFITWFGQEFQSATGSPYMATFGKENKLAEQMVGVFGLADLKRRAGLFLRDNSDFIRNSNRGIGVFRSQVNKYTNNDHKVEESQFVEFDPTADQY